MKVVHKVEPITPEETLRFLKGLKICSTTVTEALKRRGISTEEPDKELAANDPLVKLMQACRIGFEVIMEESDIPIPQSIEELKRFVGDEPDDDDEPFDVNIAGGTSNEG